MTESVEQPAGGVAPSGKKLRWPWVVGAVVAIIVAYVGWNAFDSYVLLGESKITVSPETTYLTGPLNADGTVNYTQALVDRYSEGVTPENNAVTLLAQAFDPDFLPDDVRPEILRQLGLSEEDLAAGKKFVAWRDFLKARGLDMDYDVLDELAGGPWAAEDHPEVAAWLDENAEPLAIIRQAAGCPRHYFPIVSTADPPFILIALLPELLAYRNAARALAARATLHLAEGDIDQARADVDTAHRLGRLAHPSLICHLVNIGIRNAARDAERAIIVSGKLSPDDVRAMLAECRARPPLPDYADVMEREYMVFLDATMHLYRTVGISEMELVPAIRLPDQSFLDWDRLLRQTGAYYTRIIRAAELPYPQSRAQEELMTDELQRYVVSSRTRLLVRTVFHRITLNKRAARKAYADVLARVLLSMLIPEFGKIHMLHEQARVGDDLTLLALAAKLHQADHGDWPEQLADLAPEYIDAVPKDRFTDQPLAYERAGDGVRIYSLGPNMTDDGGMNIDEAPDDETTDCSAGADDLVIELR